MGSKPLMLLAATLVAMPAAWGATLYKSVDAKGVVTFSDMPPAPGSRLLEEREIPSNGGPGYAMEAAPSPSQPQPLPEQWLDSDAVLAQANARVDAAERALAEARRVAGPTLGPVRLNNARVSLQDEDRIQREKNNVKIARQRLLELLKERRFALAQR